MYTPQIDDLTHTLNDIAGLDKLISQGVFGDLSDDLVRAVLTEAGRFAADVLAPLNRPSDIAGASHNPETGDVTTPQGWPEAYRQWAEGGWAALPCPAEFDGQGLPVMVALAVQEIWNTAMSAFGIGTLLTQGAVEAIAAHGTGELKEKYLPPMVSGRWTGTMNLTESHAGTDIGELRSSAARNADGSYAITGTKIFITHGEHDLTENIIHLVLARIAGAPAGTRGISLFLVPKFLVDDDGTPGQRNDVKCIGIEHKLGIHGSPTCTMRFGDKGGATGWLVGEENKGLSCMFTMMNNARLNVGMQGVAVAERSYQLALAYARERRQGPYPGIDGMAAIINHPDVRRMLMDMSSLTRAARAICYTTARAFDLARHGADDETCQANARLEALLTPVAKAFSTDIASEVSSLGIQIHGGMGFIEETGAAQHYRDARITRIYEGTNGIQALDLVARKLPVDGGDVVHKWLADMSTRAGELAASDNADLQDIARRLEASIGHLGEATRTVLGWLGQKDERALAAATPYLRMFGLVAGAAGLAAGAVATGDKNHIHTALYFAANHLAMTASLNDIVCTGSDTVIAAAPSSF